MPDRCFDVTKKYIARHIKKRWGLLYKEFDAYGWRARKVDLKTGHRIQGKQPGEFVFFYFGTDDDAAVKFARRTTSVSVRSRVLRPSEPKNFQ